MRGKKKKFSSEKTGLAPELDLGKRFIPERQNAHPATGFQSKMHKERIKIYIYKKKKNQEQYGRRSHDSERMQRSGEREVTIK